MDVPPTQEGGIQTVEIKKLHVALTVPDGMRTLSRGQIPNDAIRKQRTHIIALLRPSIVA